MVARSCDFAIASPFPAFHAGCGGRLAQRLRAHAEQLPPQIRGYDSRDINTPRALTRDTRPQKRLSMPGETTRRDLRERRPDARPSNSAGPPRESSAHATPCRKSAYARRKTRTPRPGGQGVHSEPAGAPVSRAPLEVGRAKRVSNWRVGFRFPERARYPIGALEKGSGSLGGSEMTPSEHPLAQEPGSAGQSFVATSSIAKSAGSSSVTVFQSRSKSTPQ